MAASRSTRQKEAILRAARGSGSHPTADRIYETVRREIPRISLGTVYRNLQRLVAEGELSLAPVDDRIARFDPMTSPHDHFVCERCERVYDFARPGDAGLDLGRFERDGFRVRSHTLAVYGVCPGCGAAANRS